MKKTQLILVIFLSIISYKSYSQNIKAIELVQRFQSLQDNFPQERVYFQISRKIFIVGEDIKGSMYAFDYKTLQPSKLSNLVYLEVLNESNEPVVRRTVPLKDGIGKVFVKLPDTLTSGGYRLMAYTNWMRNFGAETYFEENIEIYNPYKFNPRINAPKKIRTNQEEGLTFYPESGSVIENVETKIAVRYNPKNELKDSIVGYVLNEKGDTLNKVNIISGKGAFLLKQEAKMEYYFHLYDKKNLKKKIPGVDINSTHLKIETYNDIENIRCTIFTDSFFVNKNAPLVHLLVYSRGNVNYFEPLYLESQEQSILIKKESLCKGVNCAVLLSNDGEILNERLFYLPDRINKLECKTDKKIYKTREKVILDIEAFSESILTNTSLTLSVIRKENQNNTQTITEFAFINSFIRDDINFTCFEYEKSKLNINRIDDLLLSCKPVSYMWTRAIEQKQPQILFSKENVGAVIKGQILDEETLKPNVGENAILSFPGKSTNLFYSKLDSLGKFVFNIPTYDGELDIVIQLKDPNREYKVLLGDLFETSHEEISMEELIINEEKSDFIHSLGVNQQIERIYSIFEDSSLTTFNTPIINSFYGKADLIVDLSGFVNLPNMEEVFFELVRGVEVRNINNEKQIKIYNPESEQWLFSRPAIFVDGVIVYEHEKVLKIKPSLIKQIEVVHSEYYIGQIKLNGIINIITKKGMFTDLRLPNSALRRIVGNKGGEIVPEYQDVKKVSSRKPLFKNDIFWKNNIKLHKNKASVEFYTLDIPGVYQINIQGMDRNGDFLNCINDFTVNTDQ